MRTIYKSIILAAVFIITTNMIAQSPQKFNYQGVARNNLGVPLGNTTIGLQLSITDGITTLYSESFTPTTNNLGLFNVEVGNGNVVSGTFNTIDWLTGQKHLKVEMDPAGGTSYTDMGSSQLLSVPYALVAEKVSNMSISELNDVDIAGLSTNQVLMWNGTQWEPVNMSGGSDNWGSQTVVTDNTFIGNGTIGSPLALAQQGASNGQFLSWNGSAWVPAYAGGDNWGTAFVNTSSQFTGNGTPVNPLTLAQQGATTGQNLEWSGISWMPAIDDTLNLPYDASVNLSGTVFRLENGGSGISIKAVNSTALPNVVGIVGQIQNTSAGIGSSGVMGINSSTNANGFGLYGLHQGGGVGTYGSSSTGIGVFGVSIGTGGIAVLGQGNEVGVKGTSNSSTGYGVHGVALTGGYGGYFEGKTAIYSNSNAFEANLLISETETSDYVRLRMGNATPGAFWEMNAMNTGVASTEIFNIWNGFGGPLLTIKGDGNVGMGNSNPSQRLDVAGNIKFSGALMPNNQSGNSGQVLVSQGAGVAPVWGSSTNTLFNNTYFWDHTNTPSPLSSVDQPMTYNGTTDLNFNVNGASKVIVNFNQGAILGGSGDSQVRFKIQIRDNLNNIVNQANLFLDVRANKLASGSITHHCFISLPGTYKVNVQVAVTSGPTNLLIFTSTNDQGQVNVQVIPQ